MRSTKCSWRNTGWLVLLGGVVSAVAAAFSPSAYAQNLGVYLSAPLTGVSDKAGVVTENFDGMTTYGYVDEAPWAIGTATAVHDRETSWFEVGNWFGGVGGPGVGKFLYPGTGVSVQLTPGSKYLGFHWAAGDPGNRIRIFDDANQLLVDFSGQDLMDFLTAPGPFTALDPVISYPRADYFGNPWGISGGVRFNGGEPYSYVNLLLEGTPATFGRIEIIGDRFEIDNISILPSPPPHTPVPPEDTWVEVIKKPLIVPTGSIAAVDDTTSLLVNTVLVHNVNVNDTYPPGSVFQRISNPSDGAVIFNPDGSFTYTPNLDYIGPDQFEYRVCKPAPEDDQCSIASVLINIVAPTPSPTAVPTLAEWGVLTLSLGLAGAGAAQLRRRREPF